VSSQHNPRIEGYVKEAVALAMQARWEEAAAANRAILELFPDDVETCNRLGKALMEMGDYAAAREAYERALELNPYNKIAKKNLKRISQLGELAPKGDHHKVVADVFVVETSKARVVELVNLAPRGAVLRMTPGEEVSLQAEGQRLTAKDKHNEHLGEVDPKYGMRLAKLMDGGNQYIAVISSLGEDEVKLLIRETYQDPSQAGRLSFPPRKKERFRPYVRESLLRQRLEDEAGEEASEETDTEREGFVEVDF
jgi:tetratricopeptide (TPR) repeat protein